LSKRWPSGRQLPLADDLADEDPTMPAQPKHLTLSRLLELLKALPHHRWATPGELRDQLADRGFEVDLRSVQRDLKELQKSFPLDHNDKGKPHGWRWSAEAAGGIASMSTPEALMLVLVQQHLQAALPATMLEGFESLFARARQRLERLGPRSGASRWPQKVRAVAPGLPTIAPSVDARVQKALADALMSDRQVDAVYAPGAKGAPRAYLLHPLGLILRGGVTYLAATQGRGVHASLFALHRFRSVEVLPDTVSFPPGLDLDTALKRGRGQYGIAAEGAAQLQLVLACDNTVADLLEESPLGPDQQTKRMDEVQTEVRATVADSWELRWWLLSRGPSVVVLAPATLRREVADSHRRAAAAYERG
jgi:predicted DNA-binding transcriptional regulator YafY